jgi:hypothetical protein
MTDSAYPDLAKVEDWLNAKGYTGEAGACHNAMDKIREQARRIAELEAQWSQDVLFENCEYRSEAGWDRLRARIAELEAVIDEAIEYVAGHDDEWPKALAVRLRAARAAYLGEKE